MRHTTSSHKKAVKNQVYEDYWKLTLAYTGFYDDTFKRTLKIIMDHIDYYNLGNKTLDEITNLGSTGKRTLKKNVAHQKELEKKINYIFHSNDKSGATTRKKINTFIKLGFIKPYFLGYPKSSREYIKPNQNKQKLRRIFSDIVYEHASFNSSQTVDDTKNNQIKFVIKTLLNKKDKQLTYYDLIGIMTIDMSGKPYASEYEIDKGKRWADFINFANRKYNQTNHFRLLLKSLAMFNSYGQGKDFVLTTSNNDLKKVINPDTQRDPYRFNLMKQAIFEESKLIYGKKICWLTKRESAGLVVSHLYASAKALKNWDIDEAYDPNNALLLLPGNPDQYLDKYKFTIKDDGTPVYSSDVLPSFIQESNNNNYKIDSKILNSKRLHYLHIHQKMFMEKHPEFSNESMLHN